MKDKPVRQTTLAVLKQNPLLTAAIALTVVLVVALSLIPPQLLRVIIDQHLLPGVADGLLLWGLLYTGVMLFIGGFDFIKEALLVILGQRISAGIRRAMMDKLTRLNFRYFAQNDAGQIVSRFTNDVDTISALFSNGVVSMAIDCCKIIGIVISIWLFSAALGVVALLLLPVIFIITRVFRRGMLRYQSLSRVIVGRMNNHVTESLKNRQMIKSCRSEGFMEQQFRAVLADSYATNERINMFDASYAPLVMMIRAVVIGLIVVLAGGHFTVSGLSLGMLAASIELISNLFHPLESLGTELQSIQKAVSGVRRVNEFCREAEDEARDPALTAASIAPDRWELCLRVENLSFAYIPGVPVLTDIDLTLNAGETVSVVGRTGVGKSTLFKLVLGLLTPDAGAVRINGIDVARIPHAEKRRLFGYIDQQISFIPGTIAEQITMHDPAVSRERVRAVMDFVGLDHYVTSLPQGYDTPMTPERLFSHGQTQLLAIARALAADPPLLLLDEITANLDAVTEEKILSVLRAAGRDHAILSISHRFSGMIASDRVVILQDGKIKNSGAPEELFQRDAAYRQQVLLEKLQFS